jgi:hypothetical protein
MARLVLTNVEVTIAGVDLSNHIASVTLGSTYDVVETTAFAGVSGAAGNVPQAAKTRTAGLVDNSVTLEFHQDFAAASVEATIYPLLGTLVNVTVQPVNSGSVASDNPLYAFNAVVSEWTPLNGAVGELATASVTWPISGAVTKTTA